MPAYMIAEIEVHNPEMYAQYIQHARRIIPSYGGRYLARGKAIPMFGNWNPQRIIMLEFNSLAQLQKCFGSAEYRAIAPLREQSTVSRAIIMDGDAKVE